MKKHTRLEVFKTMGDTGFVPLFYNSDPKMVQQVVKACYDGGARLFEFTHRGENAEQVFSELIIFCNKECPDMILGVGSVTDAATASNFINMGASFVVTPVLREDIAIVCNRKKIFWSPGCGTLTEIARAEELGCEVVKLFPAEVYGPEFIKAVKGPQPWTNIMPTGGVDTTRENLAAWFEAGATCVGMGSKLIDKKALVEGNFDLITQKVKDVIKIIQEIKSA
ncbi:bifunctional 4-hydroxy-2-oxoglutarate aldolase/2-dehydro-3-deoxy-phosphogluconate aldolase [Flagellimonas abyssi]|uniref:Bifunctional 4-hydroxy-2-oxoglutarate aldolase/2-dehydro-3-deoxy-phosphogluconate aldolase n=1 Tax=Flagellimonas abyssi TaxID=2864871 RepID=A0ABS7ESA5_9FLAO|nr:bifunctional 4-hydroxy-2-oxoglutarate aldolase/2-dehydro-3-deoxy-phosphogluconate aldolase [Allomuricauda abyssi]MBW8200459.1 bifunctional 4-hydroxy-2-oxoglutarate aldolase/2-dehydro-3-deoxy-phosphogluconate aldolase [Allomuricauda abyssi]|tara:strand:+ start:116 stop:787 length:672 start_codon:yes stop_codon:yes gene_type:complete